MAAVNVITFTSRTDRVRAGFRYDDATLLITHVGAQNAGGSPVKVIIEHVESDRSREAVVQPGETVYRNISDVGLTVTPNGEGGFDPPFNMHIVGRM